ncbi:hypothetical protein BC629DRAFT_1440073 [Irpex lacteus]|nr:hypothetical protein BC629DRAFT_1440073 [Irpex lacteus]
MDTTQTCLGPSTAPLTCKDKSTDDAASNTQGTRCNSSTKPQPIPVNLDENRPVDRDSYPASYKLSYSGSSATDIIYETSAAKPPAPSESLYRERLAFSDKNPAGNTPTLDADYSQACFSGLVHSTDSSYASRYLAGIVPYPSLPTVGSVVPSSKSLVDLLNLSSSSSNSFFSCSSYFPSSESLVREMRTASVSDAILRSQQQ